VVLNRLPPASHEDDPTDNNNNHYILYYFCIQWNWFALVSLCSGNDFTDDTMLLTFWTRHQTQSKIVRYESSPTTAKAVKTSNLVLYIYRELVCWFQPNWLCGLDVVWSDFPLFHHYVWMMMKVSLPSTLIRRAHSVVYQEALLSFWWSFGVYFVLLRWS
jgi:hypothetical protein